MNAAIEAAPAGEKGRGFAEKADEIGKLPANYKVGKKRRGGSSDEESNNQDYIKEKEPDQIAEHLRENPDIKKSMEYLNQIEFLLLIIIGFGLDLVLGDPYYPFHPVRLIGHLIELLEKLLYPLANKRLGGIFLLITVTGVSTGILVLLLKMSAIFFILYYLVAVYFIYSSLACKSLIDEVKKVESALKAGDLVSARKNLSFIVGRETADLSEVEIIKACVETISENFVDGILSPLIYLLWGGLPMAYLFKSVSTLDSMVGYKNERYMEFGWASARMDDVLNFIPARIAAFIIIPFGAFLLNKDLKEVYCTVIQDRLKHSSPNSAHGESAFAGALQVQLGGSGKYSGKIVNKPFIGDYHSTPDLKLISDSISLTRMSTLSGFILLMLIKVLIFLFFNSI